MIDKLLAAGSIFDWITPLWAMLFSGKDSITCTIPADQIDRMWMLERIIKVWAVQIVGDEVVLFNIYKDDIPVFEKFFRQ